MTTQTAIIITQDYGSSLDTPTLRDLSGTLVATADSSNEVSDASGWYALVFTESSVHAAGWYSLRAFTSGLPINRFVRFKGVDGETAISVSELPVDSPQAGQVIVTRPVSDTTEITFSFPAENATLTGTRRINNAEGTTALSGDIDYQRADGSLYLYTLAYHADDRPSSDGVVQYVFTDGTLSRTVVLRAVTTASGADTAGVTELLTRIPDASPGTEGGLPVLSENLTVIAELDPATSTKIDNILEDTGTTMPAQIDGIEGGASLTGPFTRTVTVTDSGTSAAIQNAKVRLFRTGETGSLLTNSSGVASFTIEAATWSYAITATGYTGVSGTIVVSANGNTAVQMTAASVTAPTNPDLSAIEVLCLDEDFEAASGIDVDFRMSAVASGDQNRAHPGTKKTVTSNGSGIARFEGPQGATIEWKRGTGQQWTAVVLDNDSVTNVTSLIGSP